MSEKTYLDSRPNHNAEKTDYLLFLFVKPMTEFF